MAAKTRNVSPKKDANKSTELSIYNDETAVLAPEVTELSVEATRTQVNKVQALMKSVMKKDVHYGRIPGTGKDALYKAGAEKIGLTFRVGSRIHEEKTDLGDGHYDFSYKVELYHTPTQQFLGEGVGSASTKESKYRYRWFEEDSGVPVPMSFHKGGKISDLHEALKTKRKKVPEGASIVAKKRESDGKLHIFYKYKIDNPDIADVYNTVRKMGKKRAYVDAVISAFSLSDIFTQDIEEGAL